MLLPPPTHPASGNLPPVSTPMTTRRQRSPSNNSQYFASLRCRLRSWLHRSGMAPRCQGRSQCDVSPWPGFNCPLVPRLHGNVHVRSFTSWRTVAPASRHILANPFRWQRSLNVRIVMSHSVERGTALALSISISVRKSLGWTSNSHVSCTWTRMRARRTIGIVASRVATLLAPLKQQRVAELTLQIFPTRLIHETVSVQLL